MRHADDARRGAPLVVLATVIGVWVAYRAVAWEAPQFSPRFSHGDQDEVTPFIVTNEAASTTLGAKRTIVLPLSEYTPFPVSDTSLGAGLSARADFYRTSGYPPVPPGAGWPGTQGEMSRNTGGLVEASAAQEFERNPEPLIASTTILAQQSPAPLPGEVRSAPVSTALVLARSRWSGDAWALLRDGSETPLSSVRPSYGRSQAGFALRYDLAPSTPQRPQAYVRATSALTGPRQRELAAGLSARPIPSIPLRAHVEARVFDTQTGTQLRAAAFVVTELPVASLPGGFNGEAYAQAGYVTGDFATPFVDGQVRVTRPVVQARPVRLEAGAGAWGGAQRGSGRLDLGPTVSVTVPIGEVNARLSADYRFRVAGEAEPASGPALTLSAGF